ncbi:PREDICTED: uncharacterized protein LOC106741783 [Dinoponera quadriceps]|uniref:Uncharacterized protein LOC106741783 n=1 Tax=Dinoponera quadriceps TaxID=609295 RepID=A0A6P3WUP6_DINQU|nr:PREDICTED: uncharacterized protein LOC106741783 [Dinoponera quadriceps]
MARHLARCVLVSHLLKTSLQKPPHLERRSFLGVFVCQKRLTHKDVEILDHTCEIANYNDYRMNYKPIVQVMVQTLKEILNISTYETNKILAAHPQLKKRSRANVLNNYYNLLEAGIQKNTIVKYIWLLAHDDIKLKEKLDRISTLKMNNEDLIPWLRFTQEELVNNINYVKTDPTPYMFNKIEYLAHRLECSIEELCKLTVRCSFLLKIPVSYIDNKLNILHEYEVSNKNILKDLWILRYSEHHIRYRCDLYQDTGNEIKTWAIRCPLRVITRAIQKNYAKRDILQNYNNLNEYLLTKLNVKEEDLNILTLKWPSILRVNPKKLDKVITMLHDNGITSNEIIRTGGPIFFFNIETIQKRINTLQTKNMPIKIPTLKMSVKSFERYIGKNEISKKKSRLLQSHRNIKGYLMHKLNADEDDIEEFLDKWPLTIKVDILKIEKFINMLHEYGFTNYEILTHGRIFHFKINTIRDRIETLKEANIIPKITILMFSNKCFNDFVLSHTTEK